MALEQQDEEAQVSFRLELVSVNRRSPARIDADRVRIAEIMILDRCGQTEFPAKDP